MHEFPGEQLYSTEVRTALADLFSFAEALLNFWLDLDKSRWTTSVPMQSANLALILDAQACRLLRSVIEQCQRADGFTASILARTLFETVLAVAFLLKKDVRIIVEPTYPKGAPAGTAPNGFAAKTHSKRTKRTRKHLLSRDLRANLFLAYGYFSLEERDIKSLGKFPGMYHRARKLRRTADPRDIAQHERDIGPQWSYILRRADTYAGLKIKALAEAIGRPMLRWYETIYHFQSCAAHALDMLKHVEISDAGRLKVVFLSSTTDVYQSLRATSGLFFTHMHLLHKNIGFGSDADTAFHSLRRRYDSLSWGRRTK